MSGFRRILETGNTEEIERELSESLLPKIPKPFLRIYSEKNYTRKILKTVVKMLSKCTTVLSMLQQAPRIPILIPTAWEAPSPQYHPRTYPSLYRKKIQ